MNILFIHQNFPAQFKHLAPALVRRGHRVSAITMNPRVGEQWEGVSVIKYTPQRRSTPGVHPWMAENEAQLIRGESVYLAALQLKRSGFSPDAIVAHPGWGESLFIKEVWPTARIGLYFEYFYQAEGADMGFDSEFESPDDALKPRMRVKNFNSLLHLDLADAGLTPTRWQAQGFPDAFQSKITVIHDGIDTDHIAPNPETTINFQSVFGDQVSLDQSSEVITFVNRNLEPLRGYHRFMRALPRILKQRSNAIVLIVGDDGVSYGSSPDPAHFGSRSWKQIFIDEISGHLNEQQIRRVHFLGRVPYQHFIALLQISSVHVYLTYPFVLSWSLLEAMSAGCAIVASDTSPVREVIEHNERGRLVDFFDQDLLAAEICRLVQDVSERRRLGANARVFARENYDLKAVCLPAQLKWVGDLCCKV